jgi:hypothetical protein
MIVGMVEDNPPTHALAAALEVELRRRSTPLADQPPLGCVAPGVIDDLFDFVRLRTTLGEISILFRHASSPDTLFGVSTGPLWTDQDADDPMIVLADGLDHAADVLTSWLEGSIWSEGLHVDHVDDEGVAWLPWTLRGEGGYQPEAGPRA